MLHIVDINIKLETNNTGEPPLQEHSTMAISPCPNWQMILQCPVDGHKRTLELTMYLFKTDDKDSKFMCSFINGTKCPQDKMSVRTKCPTKCLQGMNNSKNNNFKPTSVCLIQCTVSLS